MKNLSSLGWNSQLQLELAEQASELTPARVIAIERDSVIVASDAADTHTHRRATLAGRLRRLGVSAIAVGDWVGLCDYRVEYLFARRSALVRKRVGERSGEQVIATHIDWTFVTMSLNDDFSPRRAERFVVAAWDAGTTPIVVLTKSDLASDPDAASAASGSVAGGCAVLAVSAVSGAGIEILKAAIGRGQSAVLVGSSGVGKSSLVNAMLGSERQATATIREVDAKGRHTTTRRELFVIPDTGGLIIDTPGMREFGVLSSGGDGGGLDHGFADIETFARRCSFRDCSHRTEPDCAVLEAIDSGQVDGVRLASYFKLLRELAYNDRRNDSGKQRDEKRRSKKRSLQYRQRTRRSPKS